MKIIRTLSDAREIAARLRESIDGRDAVRSAPANASLQLMEAAGPVVVSTHPGGIDALSVNTANQRERVSMIQRRSQTGIAVGSGE